MRLIISLILASVFFSCNSKKEPDVSDIKFELTTRRFEIDLFSLDTNNLAPQLDQLIAKYPSFGENFLSRILGADPRWPADSATNYVKHFITAYRPVYDTAEKIFSNFLVNFILALNKLNKFQIKIDSPEGMIFNYLKTHT